MKEYVRSIILEEVKQSQMFCIIIDTTTDLSSLEQVVFVLRYVYMGKIKERLIALETAEDSSGKGIFDVFQKIMQQYDINWKEYLYAQSYDGAASIQGQYKGLKTLIQKENDKAICVWCFAHRLNLVIVDTVDSSTNTKKFFGDLQALVNFMRARKRTAEFVKSQKLLQPLKRVRSMKNFSDTRWTSHGRVIEVVYSKFDALLNSLQKLSNSEDRVTSAGANNFLKIITSFNFILSMIFVKNIFSITTPLSNYLQSKSLEFIEAINLMKTCIKQLTHKRNDTEYEQLLSETKQFAENNCLPSTSFKENRRRNKKRMPGENTGDEVLSSPENKYKCETYFQVLDQIINSIHTRFNESHEIMKDLALLSPERIALYNNQNQTLPYDAFNRLGMWIQNLNVEQLKNEYKTFAKSFNELISIINLPSQLHTEMKNITKQREGDQNSDCELNNSSSSSSSGKSSKITDKLEKIQFHTMLHVLSTLDLSVAFPNLYLAFKAYGTIPVSSASAERTFSKAKLIKTRLRTTVTEGRLESLLMLSVEKDVQIDYEEIINRFGQ
ncbi:zinc finger protein 862-like [Metopolophium dirhodum]|uniref:zinc finger protein 862-like n=1 Tax=Metopolophium dirhodum TaxID=44670 RepID=UPI00298F6BC0|nr:zinc finger protein 862-like [Metopolophium dirhodum]